MLLKGLAKPDRPHILYRLNEEDPEEIDIEITRTVREIMMEKKIHGSKVWILIGQLADGRWAGYFRYGIGNDPHRAHAVEWAGAMSSHIRYHLLRRGFEPEGVNSLTPKSVPAGAKKILFGRYVLNIYVGIVQYFLRKMKTRRAKIYLPTQRTNRQILYDIN